MKIELELPCVEIEVILPKELLDFSEDQLQAIKDVKAILMHSGLENYGEIGLPNPRT